MDHKEQHRIHHEKERQEEKKQKKEYESEQEKSLLPFHPVWLVVLGFVMVLLALAVWTFLI